MLLLLLCSLHYRVSMLYGKVPMVEDIPYLHIQLLPVYCVLMFGFWSATIVLYRTFTFNNCDKAADELKSQIIDAKKYLQSKGLTVDKDD